MWASPFPHSQPLQSLPLLNMKHIFCLVVLVLLLATLGDAKLYPKRQGMPAIAPFRLVAKEELSFPVCPVLPSQD